MPNLAIEIARPIVLNATSRAALPAAPIDAGDRLHALDILRGLALCGMILVHFHFGFHILFTYACWGVVLLLIRGWSSRALLAAAVASAAAGPVVDEVMALHAWWAGAPPPRQTTLIALRQAAGAAAHQPDYSTLLAARWALFTGSPVRWWALFPDVNLALFIIGLLALRHGVFDEPLRHTRLIVRWMVFGAAAWAASWLLLPRIPSLGIPDADWAIEYGFGLIQDQWLCFTYIGAVVLRLAYRPQWATRLAVFGQAGRMALTNYMLQAAVLDVLSSGYGFGLTLRPLAHAPATVLLFGLEAAASRAWLARCRFGPLEWLWRVMTYATPQPIRRVTASQATESV